MSSETINDLIEHQRAWSVRLNLVASENSLPVNARLAFLTDVFNRYYFPAGKNKSWTFPGNEFLERIHQRCVDLLKEATGARFVTVRPISGMSAMTVALSALTKPGDTIGTFSPANGGHTITSFLSKRLSLKTKFIPYDQARFATDIPGLRAFMEKENITLLYLDQAHILFPHDLGAMKSALPPNGKIYYDGSHVLGLILGKNFQDPLREGAELFGGSTHKTIPGPHRGFIATNNEEAFGAIERSSDIFISHDHGADTAALAIVLEEMRGQWEEYAKKTVANARHLAGALASKGFKLAASDLGFTKSHQIWLDINDRTDAYDAVLELARCNIITNTIDAPSLPGRLAIRIGVQELTYLGASEQVMDEIAQIFSEIFITKQYSEAAIRERVKAIKHHLRHEVDEEAAEKIFALIKNR